jgi:predicted flap endonuclease-1-like 5' DNA nuclease
MTDEFTGLAAPAKRALAGAGIATLSELAQRREAEVAALHGMGPNALRLLREKLAARGLGFAG